MIFREHCSDEGFVLFDVILALVLSAVMVSLLTTATLSAHSRYRHSVLKKHILMTYQQHASDFDGLIPGGSIVHVYVEGTSTPIVSVKASARWYGNDRIETAGSPLCSPEYGEIEQIVPVMLPINAALPLTDLQVRSGIAYITADSNTSSDHDFFVIDIHDPKLPHILMSLNTGPGLKSLAVAGSYVYAAAASTAAQLHILKINSLNSVQLVKKYKLPLPEASTSPPMATAIAYGSGQIYLGTEKWDGQEFSILDVRSAESPQFIGGFETGSKIHNIFVRNGTARVAASDQYQLRTLDVKGSTPMLLSGFSPSGWQRQDGVSVTEFENDTVFGRSAGGFDITSDKEGFLWSDGAEVPHEVNSIGGVYGMILSRSKVFAITRTVNQELTVFDRNLSTTTAMYYSLPVVPQSITCDQGRIYILAKSAPAIYEVIFKQSER